jgi:hypothetical protein
MSDFEERKISRQICMDEEVYYDLKEGLLIRLKSMNQIDHDPWITTEEAMNLLRISSKTTLKKLSDQGQIRVSKMTEKIVLYYRQSLLDFIENNVKKTGNEK